MDRFEWANELQMKFKKLIDLTISKLSVILKLIINSWWMYVIFLSTPDFVDLIQKSFSNKRQIKP